MLLSNESKQRCFWVIARGYIIYGEDSRSVHGLKVSESDNESQRHSLHVWRQATFADALLETAT